MPDQPEPTPESDAFWAAKSEALHASLQEQYREQDQILQTIGALERHLERLRIQMEQTARDWSEAYSRTPRVGGFFAYNKGEATAPEPLPLPERPKSSGISVSSRQYSEMTFGSRARDLTPLTLSRVIPIAKTVVCAGFRMTLYSMELYAKGFGVHCLISPPADGFDLAPSASGTLEPAAMLRARDDRGIQYALSPYLGGANYNDRELRFSVIYAPAIVPEARHIYLSLDEIGWLGSDRERKRHVLVAKQRGPWFFTVDLQASKEHEQIVAD